MRDVLPNGLLGLAIAGLLAAFMAGMAANISAFNTVLSYDLWQTYIVKEREDHYYLRVGRIATVAAMVIAIFTAALASNFSNIMNYLQTLFGFFNAPLFATFILGMFWKRMTATAGWVGLAAGTLSAVVVAFLSEDAFGSWSTGTIPLGGQGAAFLAASTAFVVDVVLSVVVSLVTEPKPSQELKGLVYSRDAQGGPRRPQRGDVPLVPAHAAPGRRRAGHGHRPERRVLRRSETMADDTATTGKHTAGALDIRNIIGGLLGVYGVILVLMGIFGDEESDKTGDVNANLWAGLVLLVVAAVFITWARLRPVVVPEHVERPDDDGPPPGH